MVTVLQGENGRLRVAAVHTEAEDGDKADKFPNEYSAGSLAIAKVVTGNMGDKEKYFKAVSYTHLDVYKRQGRKS